jgi:hypothetical protein
MVDEYSVLPMVITRVMDSPSWRKRCLESERLVWVSGVGIEGIMTWPGSAVPPMSPLFDG